MNVIGNVVTVANEIGQIFLPRPMGVRIQSCDEASKPCSINTTDLFGDGGECLPYGIRCISRM